MEIISISIILVVSLEISHHILVSLAGSGRVLNGTGVLHLHACHLPWGAVHDLGFFVFTLLVQTELPLPQADPQTKTQDRT